MRTIGILSVCFTLVTACGTPPATGGGDGGDANEDAGASVDTGNDPFTQTDSGGSTDGAPSTEAGPGCGTIDEPDDDGIDSNCDGADGRVGFDVYVSPTGLDTNEGTPTAPKATLQSAVEKAQATGGSVLLAAGDYAPDAFTGTLASGTWKIVGGYEKSFKGKLVRERTKLKVPATGWSITGTGTEGTLQHLQIVGQAPDSDDQRSAYALRVTVQRLVLDDVLISTGNARDGTNGAVGEPGETGSPPHDENSSVLAKPSTCKGVAQPDWTAGSLTVNAEGKAAGNTASKNAGSDGSSGVPGRDGENAGKAPVLLDGLLEWTKGAPGFSDGKPGYGGAGAAPRTYITTTLLNASGGGGGCPGQGGTGATSGGGAVAIVLIGGELKITRSAIETGGGGSGGDGGAGGAGGPGARGGYPPGATSDCVKKDVFDFTTDCSGFGGRGGSGGVGGRGGGGAGGWTIGVVKVGTAKTDIDAATTFKLGAPGAGGLGKNGGYAANGERQREYAISP